MIFVGRNLALVIVIPLPIHISLYTAMADASASMGQDDIGSLEPRHPAINAMYLAATQGLDTGAASASAHALWLLLSPDDPVPIPRVGLTRAHKVLKRLRDDMRINRELKRDLGHGEVGLLVRK